MPEMIQSGNNESITQFVRGILGCGCPDEVFKKIEVQTADRPELPSGTTRINIGDTLLIYILRPISAEALLSSIERIVFAGKEDRDSHGFNRFRLVIAEDEKRLGSDLAVSKFSTETGNDEKMHIHFVATELVEGF
jgi:hypothetical protein